MTEPTPADPDRARRGVDIAARVIALVAPVACAVYAVSAPGSVLYGGAAWLGMLAAAIAGYGAVVERLVRVEVDLGLRMAWGAAGYLAIAGVFYAIGSLSYPVLAALIVVGYAAYAWRQFTQPRPALIAAADAIPRLTARPMVTLFFALIAALAIVTIAGSVAQVQGNTYDDDVVYTPLIKRTLDTGDIDEPFSFRRISAYGGQTALGALAGVRGTIANIYLVDGALFQGIMFLLVIGLIRQRERVDITTASRDGPATDQLVVGMLMLTVVLLPTVSINTGSHWTGVVLFLALYRTVTLTARGAQLTRLFAVSGLLAAAACTLRQNLLAVGVLFPLVVLLIRLGRRPWETWRSERRYWLAMIVAGTVVMLPYFVASWRSNHTILFPLQLGTFNPNIPTQPTVNTPWQELQFFLKVIVEPDPVRVMVVLLPVLFLARDLRPGRPLTAFTISTLLGFVLLIHQFTLSDQHTMWRYGFGYLFPLFLVLVLEGAAPGLRITPDDDITGGPVRIPLIGRVVLITSLIAQIAMTAKGIQRKFGTIGSDIELAAATRTHPRHDYEMQVAYGELQAAVPAGATLVVMLDEPYYLDYARNRIINMDTPGFASYAPGLPMFQGPEPVAAYFRGQHLRYVAFVRGDRSRYQFRREFWLRRIFMDTELWRVQGSYTVDAVDNFEALATTYPIRYERDGMVLLDLEAAK